MTPLFVCNQDSWVVLLSSPLQESGSVQHVIEEDAWLLVVLASVAWHFGQRKAPLRFSRSPGGAIRGRDVLCSREASTQSNQCPTERKPPAPPNAACGPGGGSSSPNCNRRLPQPSSNCTDAASILELLKGLNVPAEFQASSTLLLLNKSRKSFSVTCASRLTR